MESMKLMRVISVTSLPLKQNKKFNFTYPQKRRPIRRTATELRS